MTVSIGFTFPPDPSTLDLCAPIFAAVDHVSVAPEHLVDPRTSETLETNAFFRRLLETRDRHGLQVVAHGLSLSPCTTSRLDRPRFDGWLRRVEQLGRRVPFAWYTDHFGWTAPAGLNLTLPLPVPHVRAVRDATRDRLAALADAVGVPVGLENSVFYVPFAAADQEACFLADALGPHHLLLDVHNLWVHQQDLGTDVDDWLSAIPLDQVIELHVSGGRLAPVAWGDRRLDSHDAPVPAPVWALLERVVDRCPSLRGVTFERLERTIEPGDVEGLLADVDRVRRIVDARRARTCGSARPAPEWPDDDPEELAFADAWSSMDPLAHLGRLADDPTRSPTAREAARRWVADPIGARITHRLLLRLRFDRLLAGSARANRGWEADPAGFARAVGAYVGAVPPTAFLPRDEAALFEAWVGIAEGAV